MLLTVYLVDFFTFIGQHEIGQMDFENPSTPAPRRVTRARAKGGQNQPPIPPLKIQGLKRVMEDDLSPEPKRPARKKRTQYTGSGSRSEETSLYYIIMHSKSSLQVRLFCITLWSNGFKKFKKRKKR